MNWTEHTGAKRASSQGEQAYGNGLMQLTRTTLLVRVVLLLCCVALTGALPRSISPCPAPINATQRALYNSAFLRSPLADANVDSLNFELLAIEATLTRQAIDLGELRLGVSAIELAISNVSESESVPALKLAWQTTWSDLAAVVREEAQHMRVAGRLRSASHAYTRAWAYDFLAVRLMSSALDPVALALYNRSVVSFQSALSAAPYPSSACSRTSVPYVPLSGGVAAVGLNAYWCRPPPGTATGALVLAMSGYDGSAEVAVFEQALGAVSRGHSVLVFDGPGQGSAARFLGLHFTPNYAHVVAQVESHGRSLLGADVASQITGVVVWGRSFGGYLAPQAFSHLANATVLIADGGVDDFYQGVMCDLPQNLRQLYLSGDTATFNTYMDHGRATILGLDGLLKYGELGFGTAVPSDLYDAFSAYRLNASDYATIGGRPVLVNDPSLDSLLNNQSSTFYNALPPPRHPSSVLLQLDPLRGGGLHSSVGSSSYAPDAILDWLGGVLPPKNPPRVAGLTSQPGFGPGVGIGVGVALVAVGLFALLRSVAARMSEQRRQSCGSTGLGGREYGDERSPSGRTRSKSSSLAPDDLRLRGEGGGGVGNYGTVRSPSSSSGQAGSTEGGGGGGGLLRRSLLDGGEAST